MSWGTEAALKITVETEVVTGKPLEARNGDASRGREKRNGTCDP